MDAYDKVLDYLESLSDKDIISLWSEYCEKDNRSDDEIFPMSFLDDVYGYGRFDNMSITEVIDTIRDDFEDFDTSDDYFIVTIYGYESGNEADDFACFDIYDIANYITSNNDYLGDSEIRDILMSEDEDEDEDDEDEE